MIRACDRQGAVVILGGYYQRQDQGRPCGMRPPFAPALCMWRSWVTDRGFGNVVLDVANEYAHSGYDRPILKTSSGLAEVLLLAKHTAPRLLVSTSELGSPGHFPRGYLEEVVPACDFLLLHLNLTPLDKITARLAPVMNLGKPYSAMRTTRPVTTERAPRTSVWRTARRGG